MGLADLERLAWPACPIVAVSWRHAGGQIKFDVPPGSLAQVTSGRNYVAIMAQQAAHAPPRLLIVGAQGTVIRDISSLQSIDGKMEDVEFGCSKNLSTPTKTRSDRRKSIMIRHY